MQQRLVALGMLIGRARRAENDELRELLREASAPRGRRSASCARSPTASIRPDWTTRDCMPRRSRWPSGPLSASGWTTGSPTGCPRHWRR
ncbi:MAG TPA: hypothetical protein VGG05_04695 [Pseudonocardiaceae bacterium]